MNKKILVILAFLIVASSITAVSAFDLDGIFGSGENETATIGGIDFNIPAGFKEDSSHYNDDLSNTLKKDGYNVTGKAYVKDSTVVSIFVSNYTSSGKVIDQSALSEGGNATKIKNVDGFKKVDGEAHFFEYLKDGCFVYISSNDENAIGDFIMA